MTITRPMSATGSRTMAAPMPARPKDRPAAAALGEADSGIQVAIEQVHKDVHEHEKDRDHEHASLNERVIALDDRGKQHPADTGDRVDLLDDDRAAEQLADLDAEQRHDDDQPVLQDVPPNDESMGK